jgi:hypothetical protein
MKYLQVKNLEKYQAGSENKFWIKLWKKMRDDFAISQLSDAESWYFVGLIMLATDCDNCIPYSLSYISPRVAHMHSKRLSKVSSAVVKMLDLGLLLLCDCPIDREIDRKKEDISSSKKEKRFYKPTNEEMRFSKNKWWVIPKVGGEWLKFSGNLIKDTYLK